MVRAMLIRHIRDQYDFREEADGEAAWQVLVLDHSIELVICSLSLPVLDGDGVLVRVRSLRLSRLCQMPMLMISGDDEPAIERAKAHGASVGTAQHRPRWISIRKCGQTGTLKASAIWATFSQGVIPPMRPTSPNRNSWPT